VNLWSAEELRALLADSGLRVRDEWGEYDGSPFDVATSSRHVWLSTRESR
jgi:hypothetical protein